jgi:hypothetical protein
MECEVEGPAPDQVVGYKVEGPAPELRRLEVGDESLLGIQVEEWNRDGVPATAWLLPVSQYAWIGLEVLWPCCGERPCDGHLGGCWSADGSLVGVDAPSARTRTWVWHHGGDGA